VSEPFTPRVIEVDFNGAPSQQEIDPMMERALQLEYEATLLERYRQEIRLIQTLALSPDQLEKRLLALMECAKIDGVDLWSIRSL